MKTVFCFVKRAKSRLVLRLPSNSSFKSRNCFSVTIASRFEIVDEEYIEELKDKTENERNLQANLEEYANDVLDQRLSQFLGVQKFSNFALYVISIGNSNVSA